jgi:glycine dehydrogenase subunit 2
MHINLHKTFSTPHGGGGPGSGPIVVSKELIPFLPVPRLEKTEDGFKLVHQDERSIGRVKSFQGHFGMYVRALTYMLSHGLDGMRKASEDAVLSANYVLASLRDKYHVPFPNHHSMHECLLTDKLQKAQGATTMEIAKTLIDKGIHPMTVFFPLVVQGAMLIEPTESETKETLDGFIAVMRQIADDVANGKAEEMKQNPRQVFRRKLDEVKAAKEVRLTWNELADRAPAKAA